MTENTDRSLTPTITPSKVHLIRIALFAGVAMFGLVAWYTTSSGTMPRSSSEGLEPILYVFAVLQVSALIGAAIIKRKQEAADAWGRRVTLAIIGWALCESTALLGGVYFILTGHPELYLIAMVLFLGSLFWLVPTENARP